MTIKRLSVCLMLLACRGVQAETFRCNGEIIEEGMTQEQVRAECGNPDKVVTQTHYYWVYKRDEGALDVRVYFYANGEVREIDSFRE